MMIDTGVGASRFFSSVMLSIVQNVRVSHVAAIGGEELTRHVQEWAQSLCNDFEP